MSFEIDIVIDRQSGDWAGEAALSKLSDEVVAAFIAETKPKGGPTELGIVFTDDRAVRSLNAEWRGKDRPTNVLSFPAGMIRERGVWPPLLGDIVIAWETVAAEAQAEGKPFDHHLRHLVVHGLAHLVGYDHEQEDEAEEMEALERRVLARLAIPDPYA